MSSDGNRSGERLYRVTLQCVPLVIGLFAACAPRGDSIERAALETVFDQGRGQLQVGGPYVGVEFHHGRPLPSRVSFYHPVANSIDLSTDYWKRDESMPFEVTLMVGADTVYFGEESLTYRATPAWATFEMVAESYGARIAYRFAETLPVMVQEITVTNRSSEPTEFVIASRMRPTLRTSHAYDFKYASRSDYVQEGLVFRANYDDADTDSATVFILSVAESPASWGGDQPEPDHPEDRDGQFVYRKSVGSGETIEVVHIIGSCRESEFDSLVNRVRTQWRADVRRYERRVTEYALHGARFAIRDPALSRTARWSKAMLAANLHHLNGQIVPMPTPAQYNFFFTHDLLLTDLGAVMFDTARVVRDLRYLAMLSHPDSLLPHAHYWRNGAYVTERAGSDNWNHLWFILLASSYVKHSGDLGTIRQLYPMMRESMRQMLPNVRDGLVHSERPDWWDIGHVYGARAYLSTLMIRALRSYVYLSIELGTADNSTLGLLDLADEMSEQLTSRLWDDTAGYLLNMLDSTTVDRHYYSGSLLAAAFDILDDERKSTLLSTARNVLLDDRIGIRNAMPADFLDHIELYRFNGPEVGAPYRYMNGGVWPQGIAWYALGLLSAGELDSAKAVLKRYLTLDGIAQSPNGQPALFEYRNADYSAPDYGQIDKTTFLWAGGWYLYVLYHLAGVRENEWNLWFDSKLPSGFADVTYDLVIHGRRSLVTWSGDGPFFRSIAVDGTRVHTAVPIGQADQIALQRGLPDEPYLARATSVVDHVDYDASAQNLSLTLRGLRGQRVEAEIVSKAPPKAARIDGRNATDVLHVGEDSGAYVTLISWMTEREDVTVTIRF